MKDIFTIFVEGRIDTTTSEDFLKSVEELLDGVTELVLDFTLLDYISSSGLRAIISIKKDMGNQGNITIKNASDIVAEVFEITGFKSIVDFEWDLKNKTSILLTGFKLLDWMESLYVFYLSVF